MKIRQTLISSLLFVCAPVFAGPININTANAEQLDKELLGVGPAIAQRIVEYRSQHGTFSSPEQLAAVKGIGAKIIAKNANSIRISDAQ